MTWRTHVLCGISSLWLLVPLPPEILGYDMGTLAACAALGALLPDLDASESKIKHLELLGTNLKPFMPPGQVVSQTSQHRGLLHSLWGLRMIVAPAAIWVGWPPVTALLLGYASHLGADAMTKSGIRLLYPAPKRFYLLPAAMRVTTSSLAEEVFTIGFAMVALGLLMSQLLYKL